MSVDLSSMLELLAGGGGVDAALERLAGDGDPRLAQVASLMRQQRAQADSQLALEAGGGDDDALARDLHRAQADLEAAQGELQAALGELDALRLRNRRLAYALGACECFGERPDCEVCAGEGGSGAYRINTRLFRTLVAPALEQVRGPGGPKVPEKEEKP